jgi:SAM-dependent methyltransferase
MGVLAGMRCPSCGASALRAKGEWSADTLSAGAIECEACGAAFDVLWGFPFLGHFEPGDVLGLIEIAANAREDNTYARRSDVERLEDLLCQYHESDDRDVFRASCRDEFVHAPWFANRYSEYSSFRTLAGGVPLAGVDVLDVGAGTGYDTWRLVQAGARVTALEYNPVLVRRGRDVVPEARWVGGFAHVLPFESESFDVVCCNAALHHMRDVAGGMREMLRVIRPGGWLLTTGDPFRANHLGEELEFEVFDAHPDVLLGVNESIPRLGSIVDPLVENGACLDVTLLTSDLHGAKPWTARLHRGGRDLAEQPLTAVKWLSKLSGTLAIRARVRCSLSIAPETQARTVLPAGEYARVLSDYDAAVSSLLPLLPDSCVDREFPGHDQTKFELLNGWQKPALGGAMRTGYKRARWFLTRPDGVDSLRFRVKGLGSPTNPSVLEVQVAGTRAASTRLDEDWSEVTVGVATVPPLERFVCELRTTPERLEDASFDDYRFAVQDRRFN